MQSLPPQPTSFIGREMDVAEILRVLQNPGCRLLTVIGAGGCGKTRLALHAVQNIDRNVVPEIYFVPLQPINTIEHLISLMADVLKFPLSGQGSPQQQLLNYLRDRTLLLVLDNFEQLLEPGGAFFLADLLVAAPAVKLLVTSREALKLQEEWLYPLHGLPYPDEEGDVRDLARYGAAQLFIERAHRVRPNFSLAEEQDGVLHVCQLVEGLPLALELAATWTRTMPTTVIAAEIERNLNFLTTTLRNVPEQHRSMRAVFAHSWSLLTLDEQAVLPRLAIFRGGFRREAAENVAEATLSVLTDLVDKSLLRWETSGRYQMHELLRQYAEEQLAHSAQNAMRTRQRHAVYYLDFLHQRSAAILGGRQREATVEIGADLDNIRTAWQWAVEHQMVGAIEKAVGPLGLFFHIKCYYAEAATLFEAALEPATLFPSAQPLKARILLGLGWLAIRLGQLKQAEELFSTSLAIYQRLALSPPPGEATDPHLGLGVLASIRGDYERAEQLTHQALKVASTQNHGNNLAVANYQLASIAYAWGDYQNAQSYAQTASNTAEQVGDHWFMAYCASELGRAARALGDYVAARRHFETSYNLRQSLANPEGMALALYNLGDVALRQQQIEEAQQLFERSIVIYREIKDHGGLATAYNGLGKAMTVQGDYETARQQFRWALTIAVDIQFMPLLLSVLAAVGQFLLHTGRMQQGLTLLALARDHASTDHETKAFVQQQLRHYQATISPALFTAAKQPPNLDAAIVTAQTILAAPSPSHSEIPLAPLAPIAPAVDLVEPLTERELEVLQLIAQGLTNRQIAEQLTLAMGTVKFYTAEIYGKLGVHNRVQALTRARELHLLS